MITKEEEIISDINYDFQDYENPDYLLDDASETENLPEDYVEVSKENQLLAKQYLKLLYGKVKTY